MFAICNINITWLYDNDEIVCIENIEQNSLNLGLTPFLEQCTLGTVII